MRILLTGVPRSGTTWAGRVLGHAAGAVLVHEPDNIPGDPWKTYREVGQFPVLSGDAVAPAYSALWDLAFSGRWSLPQRSLFQARMARVLPGGMIRSAATLAARRRPAGTPVIAKSVYSAFSVEWIARRYQAEVIVIRRHALSMVGSWLELGFQPYSPGSPVQLESDPRIIETLLRPRGLRPPEPEAPLVQHVAWTVGMLSSGYEAAVGRHPEWHVVSHEQLCADPHAGFRSLYADLRLPWTAAADDFLTASNREGTGGETNRIARELPDKWRRKLTAEQIASAVAVLERFPLHPSALAGASASAGGQPAVNPGGG